MILVEELQDVLRLILFKLGIGNGSWTDLRVPQFGQDDHMVDHIDVLVCVEVNPFSELLRKTSSSQKVLHDLNVPVLQFSHFKQDLDAIRQVILRQLSNHLISLRHSLVNILDG